MSIDTRLERHQKGIKSYERQLHSYPKLSAVLFVWLFYSEAVFFLNERSTVTHAGRVFHARQVSYTGTLTSSRVITGLRGRACVKCNFCKGSGYVPVSTLDEGQPRNEEMVGYADHEVFQKAC